MTAVVVVVITLMPMTAEEIQSLGRPLITHPEQLDVDYNSIPTHTVSRTQLHLSLIHI